MPNAVLDHVGKNCLLKKIKGIRFIGKSDVYCLTVPETSNFIANGIVVHNSLDALRYALTTHFLGKDGSRLSAGDIERMRNEVYGGFSLPKPFIDPNAQTYW